MFSRLKASGWRLPKWWITVPSIALAVLLGLWLRMAKADPPSSVTYRLHGYAQVWQGSQFVPLQNTRLFFHWKYNVGESEPYEWLEYPNNYIDTNAYGNFDRTVNLTNCIYTEAGPETLGSSLFWIEQYEDLAPYVFYTGSSTQSPWEYGGQCNWGYDSTNNRWSYTPGITLSLAGGGGE